MCYDIIYYCFRYQIPETYSLSVIFSNHGVIILKSAVGGKVSKVRKKIRELETTGLKKLQIPDKDIRIYSKNGHNRFDESNNLDFGELIVRRS